jgi:Sigma-70, region 4
LVLGWPWSANTQRRVFDFGTDALAQATGTLIAVGAIYLLGVAAGAIKAAPALIIVATVGVVVGAVGAIAIADRAAFLRKRAARLLDSDSVGLAASLKRLPFVPSDAPDTRVIDALGRLPERERTILTLRFGEPMTLQAIGEGLGLTRERVRQLEAQGLARLEKELSGD